MIFSQFFLPVFSSILLVTSVLPSSSPNRFQQFWQDRKEIRERVEEQTQKFEEQVKGDVGSLTNTFRLLKSGRIAITGGILMSIDGNTLKVDKDDVVYTVLVDDKTQLRRKFWGKSDFSEFTVGDKLDIVGVWKDTAKSQITAKFIRNISIQKRHGVFIGTVSNKTDSGFILTTVARGMQQVTVSSTTEYTNRKMEKISYGDISDGHRIKVRGLWDSTNSTITEVTKVKDFDLPPRSSPDASP